MSGGDWFKFHRRYAQSEAMGYGTNWPMVGAWAAILAKARYQRQPGIFLGATIQRGEFGFTYRQLQEEWGKSPNKLKAVFDHFAAYGMIEVRNVGKCSICRVLNYERYQGSVTDSVTQESERYQSSNATDNASDNGTEGLSALLSKKDKKDMCDVPSPLSDEGNSSNDPKARKPYPEGFETLWRAYPARNGQRVGKQKAFVLWKAIASAERPDVLKAVENYAASLARPPLKGEFIPPARDAERFLKDDWWRDWVEMPAPATTGGASPSAYKPLKPPLGDST